MRYILTLITIITMSSISAQTSSIYDIQINSLMGNKIDLKKYKGKHILIVNVASKCGYTSQYKELQELHEKYKNKLVVIGVPCNQFGSQEPGNAKEIESFCQKNYGVEFLITEKVEVKGNNQHPLYKWLMSKELNKVNSSIVKWNFQKYMIDTEGKYIDVFYSATKPNSTKITKFLE
ncbi:MAG: glutathione peroxidase [Flavobacteriales bacterium]